MEHNAKIKRRERCGTKQGEKMKTKILHYVLAVVCIALLVVGCESNDTKKAKMDGAILTDQNGTKWVAKHRIADAYFLYRMDEKGINFSGN